MSTAPNFSVRVPPAHHVTRPHVHEAKATS